MVLSASRREPTRTLRGRFLRLAWINVLSNLTVPLAGLVDTAMLGHLDEIRFLAGVALAAVLFDYVYWTFGFLRMGTTGLTAQAVGRGDRPEMLLTLLRSLSVAVVVGAAILLLMVPLREAGFAILGGDPGVEAAGRQYFDARIWGAPAALCNFALLGWFLGREESRHALVMTVAANLSNIALNYLFIVRLGLAARGAGLATMLSQYVMFAVGVTILLGLGLRIPWTWGALADRASLRRLFRLNRDILIRTLCLVSAFAVFLNFSSLLGTALLAANSILQRLLSLAAYLVDGAAFAAESLAGILHGERDRAGLRRLVRLSLSSGLAAGVVFLAVLFVAPRTLVSLLTSHAELIDLTLRYSAWLVPTLLLGSLAYMYDGLFLGLTAGSQLRNTMIFSLFAVFLPVALLALRLRNNDLLWAALVLFMLARAASLGWSLRRLEDGVRL